MAIRHPELCSLVERLSSMEEPALSASDRRLLEEYAQPPRGVVYDQLGAATVEAVRELTGSDAAWSPQRASLALLSTL